MPLWPGLVIISQEWMKWVSDPQMKSKMRKGLGVKGGTKL